MPSASPTSSETPPRRPSGFPPGTVVVETHGLGKQYARSEGNRKLVRSLLLLTSRSGPSHWPIRDISIALHAGETLGLIGENGCGKTTLLSCVAGATYPTEGEVSVRGRLSALLALGTGFDYEMTPREAILVNAVILGLTVREARERTEEILGFAELLDRSNTPIRHLSSGMRARLSFAIGVLTAPDILLVDEVLAVGDEAFQEKCRDRVDQMRRGGVGIIFVSHDMALVRKMCTRVVWLDGGRVAGEGSADEIVDGYLASVASRRA